MTIVVVSVLSEDYLLPHFSLAGWLAVSDITVVVVSGDNDMPRLMFAKDT